ncbi:basic amino acid/polyamine antiporter, APA family [Saccharopolyspora antimicrobica]|uniref:Amino acid/polyamine/organocation transporter (APC superfamily) n=1 Tax=Saccharopolyspora antimicrobica TaxID=455193 RepID=A0A1I5LCJ1_9PSEU|nr:amino acid permease [Saccharopolyspora antimicrobica]RKT85450.1 amino acid/polyamine/organocation transporter (APC superfamily) [Saccharopolyspora antimicrobica]SFO95074.1 basic amino acid/polyamine antiporter, APA family [Saccharopolyspora antimicrobica]
MPGTGLWRTKSVEQSILDTDEPDTKLRKNLGTWDLIVFGVSVVIGAGIFTLAARTAGDMTGPSVSLAFVLAAIACGLAALCYAEFASTVPVAGSAYTYSYATFGEFMAWIIGWDLILEFAVAAAAVAKGWSIYLEQVFGLIGVELPTSFEFVGGLQFDWGAVLLVAVLCTLLALGTKLSARVSLVITLIKVFVVLLVIVVGVAYINADNYTPFIPPATEASASDTPAIEQSLLSLILGGETSTFGIFGLLAGASLVFFAFIGFDIVATTAEETRNPQKNAPRGILGSLAIVTVLYVAVALVVTGMVPYTDLATDESGTRSTLATAFAQHGINWAAAIIAVGALVGLTTVVMVLLLGQTRVLFAMSRDGLVPRGLAKTDPKRGTPTRATVLVGVVVLVAAGFFPADKLEEMVNVGTLFAFVLVSLGVIVLRRTRPDLPRGFRAPLVPLVPILAIIACIWLMLNLTALTWVRFLIWMAAGVVIYFLYGRNHSRLGQRIKNGDIASGGEVPRGSGSSE